MAWHPRDGCGGMQEGGDPMERNQRLILYVVIAVIIIAVIIFAL